MPPIFKGVVLAAGLGTRLRPLTLTWPKPLIPFLGTTPLELALYRLKRAGIHEVAINSHHLHGQVIQATEKNPFGQTLHVSHEPTLLGTGGVFGALKNWRNNRGLVILNGDVVSDIDINKLIDKHVVSKSVATMVLLSDVIPGESAVWYEDDIVRAITKEKKSDLKPGNFACAQVLSPEFLKLLPENGFFDIISRGYQVAFERRLKVSCVVHAGIWHDLRTPEFYWTAIKDCLKNMVSGQVADLGIKEARASRSLQTSIEDGYVLNDLADFHRSNDCRIGPWAVIEAGSIVGSMCEIRDSIVLPGANIPAGSIVDKRILGPGINVQVA
jgi:mannose-1-phosphate guanylyltransferase